MAPRLSLCIVLLLICSLTTGCFIFGGGKKKSAQAKLKAKQAGEPAMTADAAQASRSAAARRANDEKAIRDALAPKDSTVEWPASDDLKLGADKPASAELKPTLTPVPAPGGRDEDVVTIETPLAARPDAEQKSLRSVQPLDDGVAAAPNPAISARVTPATPTPDSSREAPAPAPSSVPQADAAVANHALSIDEPAAPAPAAAVVNVAPAPKPAATTGMSAGVASTDTSELSKRVAQRLRESPGDISAHLDNQLLRFLSDEQAPDLNSLSTLPAEDRELLSALIDGLSNFRNAVRADHNLLLPGKVRPILDLASRVRSLADLSIPTIALCTRVNAFGSYEPLDGRFVAGEVNKAIVYCEVANVSSQQNEQGWWESKLAQEAVLYTEDGQRVWSNPRQPVGDRSRNRRQDFFVRQLVTLPQNLTINRYILKVTVTDEQVKRVAEATMPIQVVASLAPEQSAPAGPVAKSGGAKAAGAPDARTASDKQAEVPKVRQLDQPGSTAAIEANK